MTVFLDTVGLLAVWDTSDQWHAVAAEAYAKLAEKRATFATTTYVLLETGNAAARRPYRGEVDRLRRVLEATGNLIAPTTEDWNEAWDVFRRSDAAGAGIVDNFSFVVMRRLGIREALTNDRHIAAAGFTSLF